MNVSAAKPKIVKVTAAPENAPIYINDELSGTGYAEFTRPNKNDVVIIRVECPEYKTIYSKYFGKDERPSLSFKLTQDGFYRSSAASGLVNKYFTVTIDPKYYSIQDNKIDTSLAWKMIHQIVLNIIEQGSMNIEPVKNKNLGMALLFAGDGPNVDMYRAAIIPDIVNSYATSFKFGVIFSFEKYQKGQAETGFVFNYIDEDNYSAIYLRGKELIYGKLMDGKWETVRKKEC